MLRLAREEFEVGRIIVAICKSMFTNSCLQDFAVGKEARYEELLAEASNLREEVHRLKMDKETSDTLMHGVLAMAGRDEISRKALEDEKARLITQLGYEQVRVACGCAFWDFFLIVFLFSFE
jgi:hypothetical protein